MATSRTSNTPAAANDTAPVPPPVDQDALSLTALANGVLARDFRPRVSSVRRLAEAVLAKEEAAPKPKKKKKQSSSKKSGKGSGGKKRRLAKIPGQKGKKSKKS